MMKGEFYQPQKAFINAVSATGKSHIECFDNCLLKLNLGNVSLIRVTSILPPNIQVVTSISQEIPMGINIPAVYSSKISSKADQQLAVSIAIGKTKQGPTLVAESSGKREEKVREAVESDLKRMASSRSTEVTQSIVKSTEAKVKGVTCVLAIVAELPDSFQTRKSATGKGSEVF